MLAMPTFKPRKRAFRLTVQDGQTRIVRPEITEQIAVFMWAAREAALLPELRLLFAVPNGGKRDAIEAAKLKRAGVKPGVPDMLLPVARGGYIGLAIEMKTWPNKPTDLQAEWLDALAGERWRCRVCYSATAAIDVILAYISAPKLRIAA